MPDSLGLTGRGLPIAQATLDELSYERTQGMNRWRMVRRRQSASQG